MTTMRARIQLKAIVDFGPTAAKVFQFQAVKDPDISDEQRLLQTGDGLGTVALSVDNPLALEFFKNINGDFFVEFTRVNQPD